MSELIKMMVHVPKTIDVFTLDNLCNIDRGKAPVDVHYPYPYLSYVTCTLGQGFQPLLNFGLSVSYANIIVVGLLLLLSDQR